MFNFMNQAESSVQPNAPDTSLNVIQPKKTVVYSSDYWVFILPY